MRILIKDLQTGIIREFGRNPHDRLVISEDGKTLSYYNLQNGDSSNGGYRFYFDYPNEYKCSENDFYERMIKFE